MHDFVQKLEDSWPLESWHGTRILLCVSGGADSIALLNALSQLHSNPADSIFAVHVNHQWRGDDSIADAQFVAQACEAVSVSLTTISASDYPELSQERTEQAARELRYQAFGDVARELGARYVVTAHTSDDQVETVIDRVLRGTGVLGLSGIPRTREIAHGIAMIRPMLGVSRCEVEAFLDDHGISFREDQSNEDSSYMRNRIRNELLPLIERDYQSDARSAILRLSGLASDLNDFIQSHVDQLIPAVVVVDHDKEVVIETAKFDDLADYIKGQLLISVWDCKGWPRREMGREQWQRVIDLASSESGIDELPGAIRAKKHDGQLSLTRRAE